MNLKEYIICVTMANGNITHDLTVLEIEQMKQEIAANDIMDVLNKDDAKAVMDAKVKILAS